MVVAFLLNDEFDSSDKKRKQFAALFEDAAKRKFYRAW
jgi:hypothetical protein